MFKFLFLVPVVCILLFTGACGDDDSSETTYSVKYIDNSASSGAVPIDETKYYNGQSVTVLSNTGELIRVNYAFAGWTNFSGTLYLPGTNILMGSSNIVLSAYWAPLTVTYFANGASAGSPPVDATQYLTGESATILSNSGNLKKISVLGLSYRFAGWNTREDGLGTDYTNGNAILMTSSYISLYAKWIPYGLLDNGPGGGLIFYIKSAYSNGWRYLEAAPYGWYNGADDPVLAWGPLPIDENGNAAAPESIAVGGGLSNSQWIYDAYGSEGSNTLSSYPAFNACYNFSTNGYADWFLPSLCELALMYTNLHSGGYGGFTSTSPLVFYWSSTEVDANAAADKYFTDGDEIFNDLKSYTGAVRPIRSF